MDLGEYITLLQTRALNLTPVEALSDRWEGALPTQLDGRHPFFQKDDIQVRGKDLYVSCWHMNTEAHAGMWRLYSTRRGVAVKTSWERLRHCLQADAYASDTEYQVVPVAYCDLARFELREPEPDMNEPSEHEDRRFMFKHREYAFENELRILREGADPRHPGQLGTFRWCTLPVDLNMLIEEVYFHPDTEPRVMGALIAAFGKVADWVGAYKQLSDLEPFVYEICSGIPGSRL